MNIEERNVRLLKFSEECLHILSTKGKDYNPDGVAFSEIRKEAEDMGLSPEQVMLVLAGKHWGAIKTFVKTGRLATEPIRERLKDLANYCALMAVMLEEDLVKEPDPVLRPSLEGKTVSVKVEGIRIEGAKVLSELGDEIFIEYEAANCATESRWVPRSAVMEDRL